MLKNLRLLFALLALSVFAVTGCSSSSDDAPLPVVPPGGNGVTASYTASFEGPGGHSNGAYGNVNAVHAAARAMTLLETEAAALPATTTWKMSRFKGGSSVNAIAFDGFFTVDVTAADQAGIDAFKAALDSAVAKGVKAENDFRGKTEGETNSQGGRVDVRGSVTQN